MSIITRLSRRGLLEAAGGFTTLEVISSLAHAKPAAASAFADEPSDDAPAEKTVKVLEAVYRKHSCQRTITA